mmetsp:Transcript_18972/g.27278  ORF Transcript_18972/g.27278 Transcript_18972/m.27278 type:complete len:101 (-) Transcript_18972:11-313(-)
MVIYRPKDTALSNKNRKWHERSNRRVANKQQGATYDIGIRGAENEPKYINGMMLMNRNMRTVRCIQVRHINSKTKENKKYQRFDGAPVGSIEIVEACISA